VVRDIWQEILALILGIVIVYLALRFGEWLVDITYPE
jgi:hypothetical protein